MFGVYILAVIGAISTCIAVCFSVLFLYEERREKKHGQDTANARLIVAAPRLYELLEALCVYCDCQAHRCHDRDDTIREAKRLLAYIDGKETKA